MSDESSTINDLVTQHAAKQKEGQGGDTSKENTEKKDEKPADDGKGNDAGKGNEGNPDAKALAEQLAALTKERDDLKALMEKKVEKAPEETPEEKAKREEQYRADLIGFSVKNGVMKLDDFSTLDNLSKKADKDLVFEKHLENFKEDNPDITDPEQLATAAKDAFEDEYKLNSSNEKQKVRGEARMKKEAGEIRKPYESSFSTAKEKYDTESKVRAKFPEFVQTLGEIVKNNVPDKVPFYSEKDGEENIVIDVEVSAAEREEIIKKLQTSSRFVDFMEKGKTKELEDAVKEEINTHLLVKNKDAILKKTAEAFTAVGKKKGSNVGATNSFAVNQGKADASTQKTASTKEQEVLDSLNGKK